MLNPAKRTKTINKIAAILFWLVIWQLLSWLIPTKILFASPWQVLVTCYHMLFTVEFWTTLSFSFLRISSGFFLALLSGVLLSALSARFGLVRELVLPLMRLMKAVPVASFVILALLWIKSSNLSILISYIMVLPVIYTNVLQGIETTDIKLLEMARVFRLPVRRVLRFIYLPATMPSVISACSIGLGLCWKSGIAAEVIGQPTHSIGSVLYQAKLYLMTGELFAWTAVIIIISVLFERLVMFLIRLLAKSLQ